MSGADWDFLGMSPDDDGLGLDRWITKLDWASEEADARSSSRDEMEATALREAIRFAARYGEVEVTATGRLANAWPIFAFRGKYKDLMAILADYHDDARIKDLTVEELEGHADPSSSGRITEAELRTRGVDSDDLRVRAFFEARTLEWLNADRAAQGLTAFDPQLTPSGVDARLRRFLVHGFRPTLKSHAFAWSEDKEAEGFETIFFDLDPDYPELPPQRQSVGWMVDAIAIRGGRRNVFGGTFASVEEALTYAEHELEKETK